MSKDIFDIVGTAVAAATALVLGAAGVMLVVSAFGVSGAAVVALVVVAQAAIIGLVGSLSAGLNGPIMAVAGSGGLFAALGVIFLPYGLLVAAAGLVGLAMRVAGRSRHRVVQF